MTRYGMLVDVTKCNGCYCCFLACKDEHCGTAHPGYTAAQPMTGQDWVRIVSTERGCFPKVKVDYTAVPCMHCDEATCVEAAAKAGAAEAIYKRRDGIVLIDPQKAKGHKDLASSCPYHVIFWNEEEQMPQKCTFCAHLLDEGWKEPRCVEACPTGALLFGDLDDPKSELAKALVAAGDKAETLAADSGQVEALAAFGANLRRLHAGRELKEKVHYVGLPKAFVAGSLVISDTDECAAGVTVTLEATGDEAGTQAGRPQTVVTDNFGDFEFDGLRADTSYRVKITAPGYQPLEYDVETDKSVYLGNIFLER